MVSAQREPPFVKAVISQPKANWVIPAYGRVPRREKLAGKLLYTNKS